GDDLHPVGVAVAGGSRPGLGGRPGADGLRPAHQRGGQAAARADPPEGAAVIEPDQTMTESSNGHSLPRAIEVGVAPSAAPQPRDVVFDLQSVSIDYGRSRAVDGVTLPIYANLITALIGPSGSGKSTFLRSLNRMNDTVPGFA